MCNVTRTICSGPCGHVTTHPLPANSSPASLCGKLTIVKTSYASNEFCIRCYGLKLTELETLFREKEEGRVVKYRGMGWSEEGVEGMRRKTRDEWGRAVRRMEGEWAERWVR